MGYQTIKKEISIIVLCKLRTHLIPIMLKGIDMFVYLFLRDDAFFNLDPLSAMEEKMWVSQEETSGAGGRRRRRRRRLVDAEYRQSGGKWNMARDETTHIHIHKDREREREREIHIANLREGME